MDFSNELSSPSARGQRLKELRLSLRLSRKALSIAHDIPPGTMQNWEDGRFGGLTEKGAKKIIQALSQEGLDCKLEWLMFGVGKPPIAIRHVNLQANAGLSQTEAIARELELFYQLNPGAINTMVLDNTMEPCLFAGDHVAGKQIFGNQIQQLIGHDCIVQTINGQLLVRKLAAGNAADTFHLLCRNPDVSMSAEYKNVKLFSAAVILWIRRKNILEND